MMDSLEIIAPCGQEFCLYSKLNDKIKDLEFSISMFVQPFLTRFCNVLYKAQISGEHLQHHWSSVF